MNLFFLFIGIIFLSSIFHGLTGFGFALIATPLALLFLDKMSVITAMLVISVGINGYLVKTIKRSIKKEIVIGLFLASLLGMPIGLVIINNIAINQLKVLVGVVAIVFTFILYFTRIRLSKSRLITFVMGFISGLLTTSTSMNGPPVVFLLTGRGLSKKDFRKSAVSYFFLMSIISLGLFYLNGVASNVGLVYGLVAIPFSFGASFIGNKLSSKVPNDWFRAIVLTGVLLAGLSSIISGLR